MSNITCVKIQKIESHPNATKLKVCTVQTDSEIKTIVCGAKNAYQGMLTILAPVDSVLPSGKRINQADLRGVTSEGMLCSPLDLGIREESGIIDLPAHIQVGTNYQEIPKDLLSSTPWHSYQLVDTQIESQNTIKTLRTGNLEDLKNQKIISQTYWDGEKYLYRHF